MNEELQKRYATLLLEQIRADTYPSVTYMNLLEAIAPPDVLEEYTMHLVERVEADRYPSIPMLRRVQNLVLRSTSSQADTRR